MFANLKGLFNPSNKDLRKRILFTLGCLAIFALGTNIIVPGAKEITKNLGFLELLNLMSGGSLKSFSIFALGVMPYITATIITQLLQMDIIPYFKELKEQGATGRQKLNRINRYFFSFFITFIIIYPPDKIQHTSMLNTHFVYMFHRFQLHQPTKYTALYNLHTNHNQQPKYYIHFL